MSQACQVDLSLLPTLVEILPQVPPSYIQLWLQSTFLDGSRVLDLQSPLFDEVVHLVVDQLGRGVLPDAVTTLLVSAQNADNLIYDLAPTPVLSRLRETAEFRRRTQQFAEEVQGPPCPKCESTSTRFTFQQTARADEPVSSAYICDSCNNRWG